MNLLLNTSLKKSNSIRSAAQLGSALLAALLLIGCAAQETHRTVESRTVETYRSNYAGEKSVLVVGKFQNRSNYLQGVFSSETDHMGNQAKTILKTHLQQTNRFSMVDRENMARLKEESGFNGDQQNIRGASLAITGDVTEFGRKTTGDKQLFGILGSGKKQTAYAKVSLLIVDVNTSEIIYSTQGAGEYALSEREVVGFGSSAGYDATLNGKVLNLAITEAVNNLVRDLEMGIWKAK